MIMGQMALLEAHSLYKRYPTFSLEDVSFSLQPGRITGFIGRNGAGKTTVLKLLYALIHRDGGEVLYEGKDILSCEKAYKNEVGLLFGGIEYYQNFKVGKLTSITRTFYERWDQDAYSRYIKMFGIDEGKKIKELSAGMKVKYGIALALSHNAKILLLDEPTSGLDPVSRDELLDLFTSLVEEGDKTILFSTHVISDLEKCADDIVYIQNGHILAAEPVKDFRSRYITYEGDSDDFGGAPRSSFLYVHDRAGRYLAVALAEKEREIPLKNPRRSSLEEIMIAFERGEKDKE